MPHSPSESMWLYGIHDAGGEQIMLEAGKPGWIVFSEAIGHDPLDRRGRSFLPYRLHKLGVICRLNNGYYPHGTIPKYPYYGDFARRCANFAGASPGCNIWIIGNEPNYANERPRDFMEPPLERSLTSRVHRAREEEKGRGFAPESSGYAESRGKMYSLWSTVALALSRARLRAPVSRPTDVGPMIGFHTEGLSSSDPWRRGATERFSSLRGALERTATSASHAMEAYASAEIVTPNLYANCYAQCRAAIRAMPGHGDDQVLVAAIAPWNDQTRYAGNEWGDWVLYFRDVLIQLGADGCDGFALHCHTHHADPRLIDSSATMGAPFAERHFEFRAYRDFLEAVPQEMRHLPAYITEADQSVPWQESNTGWVRKAYEEIAGWNRSAGGQTVRALVLYRWADTDRWRIEGKQGAINDFRLALRGNHRWRFPEADRWAPGDRLITLTDARLHASPGGAMNQEGLAVDELEAYSLLEAAKGRPVRAYGQIWWEVREIGACNDPRQGWLPQHGLHDERLLAALSGRRSAEISGEVGQPIRPGDTVRTLDWVRMRLTPGYVGKPSEDVVTDIAPGIVLAVVGGPEDADGLVWWLLRPQSGPASGAVGWMAEISPSGERLLERADAPPKKPDEFLFRPGDDAETLTYVRLRKSPGYIDKPGNDVVADIWQGAAVLIVDGPKLADGLTWWEVGAKTDDGVEVQGWMAQTSPEGMPLLGKRSSSPPPKYEIGDLATVGPIPVRVRRKPGYVDKPDNDVLGEFRARSTLVIQRGPVRKDELIWWRAGGIATTGELVGWVAQMTPGGVLLVGKPSLLPGTDIPNPKIGAFLGMPFADQFGIGQLWGENPAFYSRYSYDGVALLGHNGIDFLTPFGVPLLAADAGSVVETGYEPGGFGHYVLLAHVWGESVYAHMERVAVEASQRVHRGDRIGLSGNSGGSTGPHVHFAIRVHPYDRRDGWGGYSDPLPYLDPDRIVMPDYILDEELRVAREADGRAPFRMDPSPMIEDQPGLKRP